jgi:hypothetical protein
MGLTKLLDPMFLDSVKHRAQTYIGLTRLPDPVFFELNQALSPIITNKIEKKNKEEDIYIYIYIKKDKINE